MASTNQTAHYALPQYAGTDRATWTDTNQPFEDVDTALYGATQDIGQAQSQILNLQLDVGAIQVSVSSMSADVELLKTDLAKENLIVLANKANIEALQGDVVDINKDTIGATVEETMEATTDYSSGDWISVNNALFVATASITSGDALVVGTNVKAQTIKEAIETEETPGYVSVTADGIKTNAALLNELHALINASKVSSKTKLTFIAENRLDVFHMNIDNNGTYMFASAYGGPAGIADRAITIAATGSTYARSYMQNAQTPTIDDYSSNVPTSGIVYKLEY